MVFNMPKKTILSGIQPTGVFTLGNYIGAIRNWASMQEEYDCFYAIVDLHAITVRQDPNVLRRQSLDCYALLLACGLDPAKSAVFIQSHVPAHSQLSWILSCYTQFGELSRMTQFKDKSSRYSENINAGLFTYPVLQAADILIYNAHYVPVGADQKQHLELARDIAVRFNTVHGETFTLPEPYIPKEGAKVMSLTDPTAKMSKSDDNANSYVSILDPPEMIMKKFKRAVTDSDSVVCYKEGKDGVNNLMTIYGVATGMTNPQIESEFAGKGYGDFKTKTGEAVAEMLRPVREEYARLSAEKDYIRDCYTAGAERAAAVAQATLREVYDKIGFVV